MGFVCVHIFCVCVCLRFSCTFHFPHLFVLLWFIYLKWAGPLCFLKRERKKTWSRKGGKGKVEKTREEMARESNDQNMLCEKVIF